MLALVGCRNPDNIHCYGTIFRNEISLWIPRLRCPVLIQSENREVTQLSYSTAGPARLIPMGSNPKTTLWLWIREMTWYLYTRGVRWQWMQNNADLKWLCHEWFHHVRHHVVTAAPSGRTRHNHLKSRQFHSFVPWWRPSRIRSQRTRPSQSEISAPHWTLGQLKKIWCVNFVVP